jgi:hypothetical protein
VIAARLHVLPMVVAVRSSLRGVLQTPFQKSESITGL